MPLSSFDRNEQKMNESHGEGVSLAHGAEFLTAIGTGGGDIVQIAVGLLLRGVLSGWSCYNQSKERSWLAVWIEEGTFSGEATRERKELAGSIDF